LKHQFISFPGTRNENRLELGRARL
jgi:hypothetical protein